ncbi:flagellar basal body L-ring protein FlgH [Dyella sp. LX-66]|uniref:flagellar basal body L-ring protein FlgH n=1 Tax=unclassified Dyella TaxID=2634549 RepID=UPI001BE08FBA|nr:MULTISPECIES: flagellar basal body L-ring protein FlgH [unclassified Dyella]MBT2116005.1 flagellar basal body L-ring protein FlgH [Dyella sp. LX-1]MBT2138015.1 flagellar basal body L-ring protein FlgH [Dyella sp. LX-66]
MSNFRHLRLCGALIVLAQLAGCAMPAPRGDDAAWAATPPQEPVAPPAADGSIYHEAQNMELFNDPRAHRVGDILTVSLVESTQASKKASTSTSKKDKSNLAAPTILGRPVSIGGTDVSFGTSGDRSFDGSGNSSQSNQLTGSITVTVAQRLSNGNLLVRGEKWLTINQGQELVRISGIVRPQDIGQDNSVPSTRVADARIGYTGRGTLADANTQGWLSRFFSSKWMPF